MPEIHPFHPLFIMILRKHSRSVLGLRQPSAALDRERGGRRMPKDLDRVRKRQRSGALQTLAELAAASPLRCPVWAGFRSIVAALLILCVMTSSGLAWAQTDSSSNQPAPSVQEQLDALKKGQERILQELEALKALIQHTPARSEMAARPSATNLIILNVHGEPFRGSSNAPIAIVEYSDFNCPFCRKYAHDIFPRIDEKLIKTGKIKYFFRDLPEPGDAKSFLLARAARCAGEQQRFWEMHARLFATEDKTEREDVDFQARAIGLDLDRFNACMSSGRYAAAIRRSVLTARRAGINGTPGFVIGTLSDDGDVVRASQVLVGAEDYETFEKIVAELPSAKPAASP
jgi:protein-disulfide isomerase